MKYRYSLCLCAIISIFTFQALHALHLGNLLLSFFPLVQLVVCSLFEPFVSNVLSGFRYSLHFGFGTKTHILLYISDQTVSIFPISASTMILVLLRSQMLCS